jgi:2-polyprenyl-6-methoxyphenol hydroxylase-like FAD-dependent oxidoreductase
MLISMPHVVVQPAKPRIAIIGSGLAGEVLAAKLAAFCHVTVYERGSLNGYSPPVLAKGRSLGLTSTISYGRGGTTALWRGNMLEMEPDEYGSHWPESVRKEMPRFQAEVIDHRVGARSNASWSETKQRDITFGEVLVRSLLVPKKAPRLARSPTWKQVSFCRDCLVERLEEDDDGLVVVSSDGEGQQRHPFDFAVLCAGALNSPLILRRSGMALSRAG